jgi:glutathione S-transferase
MADDLGNKPWCTGDFFNLADIATGCCLGFLALRLPATDWRNEEQEEANLILEAFGFIWAAKSSVNTTSCS